MRAKRDSNEYNRVVISGASIEELNNNEQWERFYVDSPQRTPYSSLDFLSLEGNFHQKYVLKKQNEILAALIVPTNFNGGLKPGSFGSIHQGILFSSRVDSSTNNRADAFQTLLSLAIKNEIKFDVSLHPNIYDLRPVNWINSDLPQENKIIIQVKYTGQIYLDEYLNYQDYFSRLPKMRRDEILKGPLRIETSNDHTLFAELHRESFANRGIDFTSDEWEELTTIFQFATTHPAGKLTLAFDEGSSKPISGIITIEDANTVYYWFAATKPGFRNLAPNSKLISLAVSQAIESKKFKFDTCGMNSKEIGFFKSSFGAKPTPIYQLRHI